MQGAVDPMGGQRVERAADTIHAKRRLGSEERPMRNRRFVKIVVWVVVVAMGLAAAVSSVAFLTN